ncbi:MAG: putative cupin superfamily protein [Cognaticolwellia sp.]|jgi:uncharacterized cupin superfamily protein
MYLTRGSETREESWFTGKIGHHFKVLTPENREQECMGASLNRLPQGCVAVPFHWHALEDELFYILSGRGIFRYGEELAEVGPGDTINCPAGTGIAHQIGNPHAEDLVYLCVGGHETQEVCGYPDNGKVMVRSTKQVGILEEQPYMQGEPEAPEIFRLWAEKG